MSRRKVQKTVLELVAVLALYVVAAFAVDAALIFLLGVEGWPVQVANFLIAVVCGHKVSKWNQRHDDLEQQRSEVDS